MSHARRAAFALVVAALAGAASAQTTTVELQGTQFHQSMGFSLAPAGDVDGDGMMDLIVGRPGDVAPSEPDQIFGFVFVVSAATGAQIRSHTSPLPLERFGWSVCGGGDVDIDGVPDVVVGSNQYGDSLASPQTSLRAYSGATGALLFQWKGQANELLAHTVVSNVDLDVDGHADVLASSRFNAGAVIAFAGSDGHRMYRLDGGTAQGHFGDQIAVLGDLDNDGATDFAVAESGTLKGFAEFTVPGSTQVFSGKLGLPLWRVDGTAPDENEGSLLAAVADRDGDGRLDLASGSWRTGITKIRSSITHAVLATYGTDVGLQSAVLREIGDYDGDGTPDLAVGHMNNAGFKGTTRVISGANGASLALRTGAASSEAHGIALAALGDVDGDGRVEFAAGGHRFGGAPAPQRGRVRIFTGCNDPVAILGTGCKGSLGAPPVLDPDGCFYPGGAVSLRVGGGHPNSLGLLLLGAPGPAPAPGSCAPASTLAVMIPFALDGGGLAAIAGAIPETAATTGSFALQAYLAGPFGAPAATPGIVATLHP